LAHLLLLTHGKELFDGKDARRRALSASRKSVLETNDAVPEVMGFRIHPATTWGRPLKDTLL